MMDARVRAAAAGAAAFRAVVRWLRALGRPVPLRVKLVAALLTLCAIGLAAAGGAGVVTLRHYLIGRLDDRLGAPPRFGGGNCDGGGPRQTTAMYTQVTDVSGQLAGGQLCVLSTAPDQTAPQLPVLTAARVTKLAGQPFTVPPTGAGSHWRVIVRDTPRGVVTTAFTLDEVDATVGALASKSLSAYLIVLVALALLGWIAVTSSLRRLVAVEKTAEAIAAGDLARRVPGADERTEVGRLAAALNTMLAQIEAAFRSRETSEAAARASEERMRRFVTDASHELRTPLTSIRGFAELHRQGAVREAEGVERIMRRIESEAARMGLLVDDLLLLARMDQQRPLDQRPVDLLELATDAVAAARAVDPGRPVTVELSGDDGPPVVVGDDARLRQVIGNLVSNALTHTPAGTPVRVGVAAAADVARLWVADAGPGLAPEHAERVFERFYRADPARTRANGGTGLGLSIVAALVSAHSGTVAVTTSPGGGTRFDVELPLWPAPPPPLAVSSEPAGPHTPPAGT
jgi:two-component system OmpR family sensor kinase